MRLGWYAARFHKHCLKSYVPEAACDGLYSSFSLSTLTETSLLEESSKEAEMV